MKKLFVSAVVATLAISLLASCGYSRKTGCPAVAKTTVQKKAVNS